MADTRIILTKEEAQRKAEEKAAVIGITFERMLNGVLETRTVGTVEHIAAFFNSSDEGPNAKNKQDFGWRLTPEDLIELEDLKNDPVIMDRIASAYQIPAEDVADYNVLKYMASTRFSVVKNDTRGEMKDYENDYQRRVREAREGKSTPVQTELTDEEKEAKGAEAEAKKEAAQAKKEADKKAKAEKLEKSGDKADNGGKA